MRSRHRSSLLRASPSMCPRKRGQLHRDFSEWPLVFANPLMASASMDRLMHRSTVPRSWSSKARATAWTASCAGHANCRRPNRRDHRRRGPVRTGHIVAPPRSAGRHRQPTWRFIEGIPVYHPAGENAVTTILARRFFGSRLVSTLREPDSPRRPPAAMRNSMAEADPGSRRRPPGRPAPPRSRVHPQQ